jgi:hypothetical protein
VSQTPYFVLIAMIRYKRANQITDSGLPYPLKSWLLRRVWPNPYNKTDIENEAIFVHIPKNAGSAVKSHLGLVEDGHDRAIWYKMYDPRRFERYFKFTVVRNPWSRLVSAYFYLTQGRGHDTTMKWVRQNLSQYDSFRKFVLDLQDLETRKRILSWVHFMPQYKWIQGENGENCMDWLVHIERIQKDFERVRSYFGKESKIEKKNKSKHERYKLHYDKETKQIAKKVYERDIEMLGYSF